MPHKKDNGRRIAKIRIPIMELTKPEYIQNHACMSGLWDEIVSIAPDDVLTAAEAPILELLCHLRMKLRKNGLSCEKNDGGLTASEQSQMINALKAIGATPTERKRAQKRERTPEKSAFDEFGSK